MKHLVLAAGIFTIAGAASAQDFYLGGSVDYATPHSGDAHASVGLMGGVAFNRGAPLSFAGQAEYSAPLAGSDNYDAARLRGLASYDFGGFAGVGGLGVTQYRDGGTNYNGFNFSLGVDVKLQSGPATVRVEMVRDFMDDYGTDVTTTRVGYMYNF